MEFLDQPLIQSAVIPPLIAGLGQSVPMLKLPKRILDRFHVEERRHALAILEMDLPDELRDILDCLAQFRLPRREIESGGGGKTKIAGRFDGFLGSRGWGEEQTKVEWSINGVMVQSHMHKIDFCKNQIAIELEWNNKDPFFARDLNALRMRHDLNAIAVGVIITRMDELQEIFNSLKRQGSGKSLGRKDGASTTHWSKRMPHVKAGAAGPCLLLLIGIRKECYEDDVGSADAGSLAVIGRKKRSVFLIGINLIPPWIPT